MRAGFIVHGIAYQEEQTTVILKTDDHVPGSDGRMGDKATIVIVGCRPLAIAPGDRVTLTIEARGAHPGDEKGGDR